MTDWFDPSTPLIPPRRPRQPSKRAAEKAAARSEERRLVLERVFVLAAERASRGPRPPVCQEDAFCTLPDLHDEKHDSLL